jgi:tetratricopeptide (TPR) repeat protein
VIKNIKLNNIVPTYSHQDRLFFCILLLAPWLLFWQTTGYELVWDDIPIHLVRNPYLNPPSIKNILQLWMEPYEGLYIPMAYTLWGGLKTVGDLFSSNPDNSFIFHFANIFIHTCNGLVIFILLKRLIQSSWEAAMGSLIFLVHPIQVESVAWASELRGLGAAFLMFLGLLYYIKSCEIRHASGKPKMHILYSGLSIFLFAGSLLFKPSTVVMPLFAVLLEYHLFKRINRSSVYHLLLLIVPVLAIALTTFSIQQESPYSQFWARPLIWMDAINFYMYKVCLPFSLAASYARTPSYIISLPWTYILWIIPFFFATIAIYFRKKYPLAFIAAFIFLLGFLPVSGLIPFFFQRWSTTADRYLYISMFGTALGFAWLVSSAKQKWVKIMVMGWIIFLAGWSASIQIPVWMNNSTLWHHCIKKTPREAMAYINRGEIYLNQKDYSMALSDFNKAIEYDPYYAEVYINRGIILFEQGAYSKAIQDYNRAIQLNPEFEEAYINRSLVYLKLKQYDKALADLEQAVMLRPDSAKAHNNLGAVFNAKGQFAAAIDAYTRAVSIDPQYGDAYINRSLVYLKLKQYDEVLADLEQAVMLRPDSAKAHNIMGIVFNAKGQFDAAVDAYTRAVSIDSRYADAYYNRGIIYSEQKLFDKALLDYSNSIRFKPEKETTYFIRAILYIKIGSYHKALPDLNTFIRIQPIHANAFLLRGNVHQKLNLPEKAIEDYNQVLEIDPNNYEALVNKGVVLLAKNEHDSALTTLNAAIEIDPGSQNAYFHRGNAFQSIMEYSKAIADYNQSILLNPENPELYNNRSIAFYHQKQYQKAVTDLLTVKKLGGTANPKLINALRSYMDN